MLATCRKWLHTCKDSPFLRRNALMKKYLGVSMDMEEGLFHTCHSLVLIKGLLYTSTMPKGEAEGILAFVVPTGQHCTALTGVHHDTGHQGQQRTLAGMVLLAHDDGRLQSTGMGMSVMLCLKNLAVLQL